MNRCILIDAGAYMGQSTQKFTETAAYSFCPWQMHAFEAHPELCALITAREDLQIHNKAVWTGNGSIPFFGTKIRKNYLKNEEKPLSPGQGSSLIKHKITGNLDIENPINIPSLDIGQWIKTVFTKDDYILFKLDVEGAEFEILDHMLKDGSIDYVDWLFIEFHATKVGQKPEVEQDLKDNLLARGVRFVEDEEGQATGDWFRNHDMTILNEIMDRTHAILKHA